MTQYEVYRITVNDSMVVDYSSGFTDNNRFFLSAPLNYYAKIVRNYGQEPTLQFLQSKLGDSYQGVRPVAERLHAGNLDTTAFINWYVRYLRQSLHTNVQRLQVAVVSCHFTNAAKIEEDSSHLLLAWKEQ